MRWSAIIAVIIGWNALFMLDFARPGHTPSSPGWFACVALLLVFAVSVGTLTSTTLQRLILKPDRNVGEIRSFLRLLAFVSGLLFVIFSILLASGAFNQAPNQTGQATRRHAASPGAVRQFGRAVPCSTLFASGGR